MSTCLIFRDGLGCHDKGVTVQGSRLLFFFTAR